MSTELWPVHSGVAPIGLTKSIGQLWADANNSNVYAPNGFVMYPKNYGGGAITLRVNMQEDGRGAPGVWNKFVPNGKGPSGHSIKTVRMNENGSATITYTGSQTGSLLPITEKLRVTK